MSGLRRSVGPSILCWLQDEMDAFEKLLKLGLKDQQEREIMHIAILCCMREKTYNPYYALLIDKFCVFHKRFRVGGGVRLCGK
jgi:nucleolar MIF4G domain-containing protein 1